jgi:hypothetical protein
LKVVERRIRNPNNSNSGTGFEQLQNNKPEKINCFVSLCKIQYVGASSANLLAIFGIKTGAALKQCPAVGQITIADNLLSVLSIVKRKKMLYR